MAWAIDGSIFGVPMLVLGLAPGAEGAIGGLFLLSFIYFLVCWAIAGRTIGHAIMSIRIVSIDNTTSLTGIGIGWIRATLRLIMRSVLSVFLIAWWPCIFRKDCRGIHDLISGTMIVDATEVERGHRKQEIFIDPDA